MSYMGSNGCSSYVGPVTSLLNYMELTMGGLYIRGYIGIIYGSGRFSLIMENGLEKKIENETETGTIYGFIASRSLGCMGVSKTQRGPRQG